MQLALLKAQKENIEADTLNKNVDAKKKAGIDTDLAGQELKSEEQKTELLDLERRFNLNTLEERQKAVELQNSLTEVETKLKESGIDVNRGTIKKMIEDVAQGWEHLRLKEQETRIKEFEAELKAEYPSIDSVGGGALNEMVRAIRDTFNVKTRAKKVE